MSNSSEQQTPGTEGELKVIRDVGDDGNESRNEEGEGGQHSEDTKKVISNNSIQQQEHTAKVESKFQAPVLSTIYDGQPFTDLVRNLENFIGEKTVDQFQPLFSFCGDANALPRLTSGGKTSSDEAAVDLSEPIALRHIHSTPLVHIASMLDDEDEDEPPPLGLEILTRSRSTPLSTSANSAFGSINKPNLPYINGPDGRSAFTLPPYRLKPTRSGDSISAHLDVFNSISYDADHETDSTAIEVMDMPLPREEKESPKIASPPRSLASKTASRASKFLSDVRNIRRRRRVRSGRENPARPPSVSEDSATKNSGDEETISSKSSRSKSAGSSIKASRGKSKDRSVEKGSMEPEANASPNSCLEAQSPISLSSATEAGDLNSQRVGRVRIQISQTEESPRPSQAHNDSAHPATPVPSRLAHDSNTLTGHSHDSPETSHSYSTSHTSGHTTHTTNTSFSSGQVSHLSSISETDREVMEVNKVRKVLMAPAGAATGTFCAHSDSSQSTPRPGYPGYIEVSNSPASLRDGANVPADRFFTFFESPSHRIGLNGRLRTLSSLRRNPSSQSPTTVSSSSMTTNSSASSQEEPPNFVSYLDRKTTSDLTSLRETDERSSPRTGGPMGEERESSPAELLSESNVLFEEAQAPGGNQDSTSRPRPIWAHRGFQLGRKVRSLPPRSPLKTPSTPPPRGGAVSPGHDALSPPREIVNHRIDPNVSRPYVLRSTPPSTRLLSSRKVSPEVLSTYRNVNYAHIPEGTPDQGAYEVVRMGTNHDVTRGYYVASQRASPTNSLRSRTYDEHNIEILKTDSKDETSPTLVTPERCPSN